MSEKSSRFRPLSRVTRALALYSQAVKAPDPNPWLRAIETELRKIAKDHGWLLQIRLRDAAPMLAADPSPVARDSRG